jgi:hypothetical protein
MSVLDMFASALGAFIMCSVILFPYFKKDVTQEVVAAKETLQAKSKELETKKKEVRLIDEKIQKQDQEVKQVRDLQAKLSICKQGLNQCQVAVGKNFLLVEIQWDKEVNVDLHVTDSGGNEYYWRKTNRCECEFPGKKARLSVDSFGSSRGGIEVWVDPEVKPGSYFVDYIIDRPSSDEIKVVGTVIDRLGTHPIEVKTMTRRDNVSREIKVRAAEIQINASGDLDIR